MRVLVNNHVGVHAAVAEPTREDEHLHAQMRPVGWSAEIGIINAGAILSVREDSIAAHAALAEVVLLEISRGLSKPAVIEQIVIEIAHEKEVCYDSGQVGGSANVARGVRSEEHTS